MRHPTPDELVEGLLITLINEAKGPYYVLHANKDGWDLVPISGEGSLSRILPSVVCTHAFI